MNLTAIGREIVDGVEFAYADSNRFTVYNKGNFYTLSEAFANELLTQNDLKNIAHYHNLTC